MKLIDQYKGLRKEVYILSLGRMVTNLGAMINPVLTLILNQKLGMDATQVAFVTILSGMIVLPAGLLGGKVADRFSKKNVIIYCDILSVMLYLICAVIPLTLFSVVLIMIAAAAQYMEHPAYNALIADLTTIEDRQRAYSLQYLGANLGFVAAPSIAGILFNHYLWLSFIISAVAIATSTVLIFLKVKDITPVIDYTNVHNSYQRENKDLSLKNVLLLNRPVLLYIILFGLFDAAYQQYTYLMPLDMAGFHGDKGALIFGTVTSVNCIVVILFTPLLTNLGRKISHTKNLLMGEVLLLSAYVVYLSMLGKIPFYYVAMTLFTFGEIITAVSNGPYMTERIPSSHRGRINGLMDASRCVFYGLSLVITGRIYDSAGSIAAWVCVLIILGIAIAGGIWLIFYDRKRYRDLYL